MEKIYTVKEAKKINIISLYSTEIYKINIISLYCIEIYKFNINVRHFK